jgi:hypothetical protein
MKSLFSLKICTVTVLWEKDGKKESKEGRRNTEKKRETERGGRDQLSFTSSDFISALKIYLPRFTFF